MQDLKHSIFVQSDDRCDDGKKDLKSRAAILKDIKDANEFSKIACDTWLDVRTFGQVFAFNGFACSSVGVRGPVSIHLAKSVNPVEIQSMQITKSVSGDVKEGKSKGSDTMGTKHFVRFGLYTVKGSVNVQLAKKTGFTDADILKKCLKTLFVNDSSAARPDGSLEVVKLFWWEHGCKDGQYSSAKVHNLVKISLKDGVTEPHSAEDYNISLNSLDGLACEEINGI